MFGRTNIGYDQAITVFSPEGRLYQVEYALEAIKKGLTSIAIKCDEGVVFCCEKKSSKLIDTDSLPNHKLFAIDDHIGLTMAGLSADARILIKLSRESAQSYRMIYGEPSPVEYITKSIADVKQIYTQHAGARPFGCSFLMGGITQDKPKLYLTEPSGSIFAYKAYAIGRYAVSIREFLENEYKSEKSIENVIILALRALRKVSPKELSVNNVELGYITVKDKKFTILTDKNIQEYLEKLENHGEEE